MGNEIGHDRREEFNKEAPETAEPQPAEEAPKAKLEVGPEHTPLAEDQPDQAGNEACCVHQQELEEKIRLLDERELELVEIRQECETLKREKQNISQEQHQMEKEVANKVEEQLAQVKEMLDVGRKRAETDSNLLEAKEKEIETNTAERGQLQRECEQLRLKLKEKEREIASNEARYSDERKQLLRDHQLQQEARIRELEIKLASDDDDQILAEDELRHIDEIAEIRNLCDKQCDRLQAEKNELKVDFDKERNTLQEQQDSLQESSGKLKDEYRQLRMDFDRITTERDELKTQFDEMRKGRDTLQGEYKRMRVKENTLHEEISTEFQAEAACNNETVTKLQSEIAHYKNACLKKSEEEKRNLEAKMISLQQGAAQVQANPQLILASASTGPFKQSVPAKTKCDNDEMQFNLPDGSLRNFNVMHAKNQKERGTSGFTDLQGHDNVSKKDQIEIIVNVQNYEQNSLPCPYSQLQVEQVPPYLSVPVNILLASLSPEDQED